LSVYLKVENRTKTNNSCHKGTKTKKIEFIIVTSCLSTCIRKYDDVLKVGFRCQVSGMEIAIAET